MRYHKIRHLVTGRFETTRGTHCTARRNHRLGPQPANSDPPAVLSGASREGMHIVDDHDSLADARHTCCILTWEAGRN